ncbi:efflux RND transporter periplasmic adaptor subunit [Labilibacter marinus]|uniref:efflux RND transporter periplasmic adaptor subunit n=1 Tax=Labilibacter marinus TaxID=1477105 RepID=UPI000833BBAA|nr:efflux RND transporter periplasmic adaptor subunit [Labilibacter marinus]
MKKIFTLLFSVLLLASCTETDTEKIKAEIKANKAQIQELKAKNKELEEELAKVDTVEIKHRIPIITRTISTKTFNHFIETSGLLEAKEIAYISPEVPGQVTKIHVMEGQRVNKGQLLISLNSSVIKNAIREIETNLELATTTFKKQENLWNQNIGSEIEYLQAKAQKESLESTLESQNEQLKMYNVTAPFSGIVDDIIIKEGEHSSPGMTNVLSLVNLDKMKVNSDVSEVYLPAIHKGDTVKLSFSTYPDLIIETPISRTSNIVHPDNRTFNVQIVLDNINNKLKPNMMAKLQIKDYSLSNAITVPSAIIKNDISGKFLFTVQEGQAQKVYIETGRSYKDETLVTKGLMAGDVVVVEGYNTVSNGALVAEK